MAGWYVAPYNSSYSSAYNTWSDTSDRSSETSDDDISYDTWYHDTSYDDISYDDISYDDTSDDDISYDTWYHDTSYDDISYDDISYDDTSYDDISYDTWHNTSSDTSYITSYNSHGKKYEVPRKRVFSLHELQSGDHIAFHRLNGAFWHHAIVEDIDILEGEIQIIEYTNTAKGFIEDNFILPKTPRIAKVARGTYKFQNNKVFLMLHQQCLDPDSVVIRARSKIGKGKYHPFTNNCEHFAMWCKTGISSSDQVNKIEEMVSKEVTSKGIPKAVTEAAAKARKVVVVTGGRVATRAGQGAIVREGTRVATRAGQAAIAREGTRVATRAGQAAIVREGTRVATRAGQAAIVRAGGHTVSRGVWGQTVSGAGQGVATSSTSAIAPIGGALCAAATEGLSMAYDISRVHADMQAGRISQREYHEATGKRIVTGTANVACSTAGAVIGQALIPVPILGGAVGAIFGGLTGSFVGNILANS